MKPQRILAVLVAISLLAVATISGSSSEAVTLPFSGTLSLTFNQVTFSTTGSGTGNSAGSGGAATIPANVFAMNSSVVFSPPFGGVFTGFAVCAAGIVTGTTLTVPSAMAACGNSATNNALSFTGTTGTGGLNGSGYFTGGVLGTGFATTGEIPLAVVAAGGSTSGTALGSVSGPIVTFTITGNPWTIAPVTSTGFPSGSGGMPVVLTAAGFDNRDASGQGTLQLVTAGLLSLTEGSGTVSAPMISTITLTFAPEPGTALLVGSGIAGLAMLGRRRIRE